MRRMYYHRFSGLRSCYIISSLPGLVIFIFSILSPSSPIFSFLFFSPSSSLFPTIFSLPQVHDYWICQRQEAITCCRTAIVSIFFTIVTITIIIFSRFILSPFSVYHRITSRCVHGELDHLCSGRDDTGVYVLLRLLPIR
ncbi:hypothetical protein EDD22DRAFT_332973 [Suillus occidentalis]|nr:hypothetical protein EDD22DRAFT_332973 [Suillus occidentalis]